MTLPSEGLPSSPTTAGFFEYLQRLGDDRLVLGHRLSEWAGHAPILEEDIALANIALDLIGQANLLLTLAGEVEGAGRNQDSLAFFRNETQFRNALIMELPRGDFGFTIVRQFLVSALWELQLTGLARSTHETLAGIAAKAHKETRYHLRHSAEWVIKLGDGTAESRARVQTALDELWRYTAELFEVDDLERELIAAGIAPDVGALEPAWKERVTTVFAQATLTVPGSGFMRHGGRSGRHSEHLGHMLAEMQSVARSFPGASW